jgi:hypothetical protein
MSDTEARTFISEDSCVESSILNLAVHCFNPLDGDALDLDVVEIFDGLIKLKQTNQPILLPYVVKLIPDTLDAVEVSKTTTNDSPIANDSFIC